MPASDIICLNDILVRDLYSHSTIEGAIDELKDLAVNLNRSTLFFAWMVGKFASNRKLHTQFNVESKRQLAKLLETSEATIYRYIDVYNMLTEAQVKQLGQMGVSVNCVLEIATQRKSNKELANEILELVLSNQLSTVPDIKSHCSTVIAQRAQPYNLLPGGEPPTPETPFSDIEDDMEDGRLAATTPGQRILDAEIVDDVDNDSGDDSNRKVDDDKSQNKRDAESMLRIARQSTTAIKRDFFNINRDLAVMLDKLEDQHSVILGDTVSSDEYDRIVEEMYVEMSRAVRTIIEQLKRGVDSGYIPTQIPMPQAGKDAFNGLGLFSQD